VRAGQDVHAEYDVVDPPGKSRAVEAKHALAIDLLSGRARDVAVTAAGDVGERTQRSSRICSAVQAIAGPFGDGYSPGQAETMVHFLPSRLGGLVVSESVVIFVRKQPIRPVKDRVLIPRPFPDSKVAFTAISL
jgi:hypothetical protein